MADLIQIGKGTTSRRGFLASASGVVAGLLGLVRTKPPHPPHPHRTTTTAPAATTTLPATSTTTGIMPTTTNITIGTGVDVTYGVAKTGNDSNSGTLSQPLLTIQAAVDKAAVDNAANKTTRILVSPGTYREQVTISSGGTIKAMTLEANGTGVVVSGADDWTGGWTTHDAPNRLYWRAWTNNWGVEAVPGGWPTDQGWTDIYRRRELVVIDGVWVRQVLTLAELTAYEAAYFVDEAADRLYVRIPTGGDIATILIEVGLRQRTLEATSRPNLTLRGLVFQHGVPTISNPGVNVTGCTNAVVEDCESRQHSWANWGGASAGATYRRVKFNDGGVVGFGANTVEDMLFEDCENNRNNTFRGAWAGFKDWEDGFKIFRARRTTFRRCDWFDNNSPGFWADTDIKDVLLEDCRIAGNTGAAGCFTELTQGPVTYRRCKITQNFRGLFGSNSRGIVIDDCDIWDNGIEIGVPVNAPAGSTVTEYDTSNVINVDPRDWQLLNTLVWVSPTDADKIAWAVPSPFTQSELWRTTATLSGNAYHSTVNTAPFQKRDVGGATFVDFAGWKTWLAGSRDSTSTFSSSAPSPAPSL